MLFNKDIYLTSLFNLTRKMWKFIYTFIFAQMSSKLINSATSYDSYGVLKYSLTFFLIVIISKFIDLLLNLYNENRIIKSKQNYKEYLYKFMFEQKVHVIENLSVGGIKERLNDDRNTTFCFLSENIPSIITGFFVTLGYAIYISRINLYLCLFVVIISVLQMIPPFVVKKYLIQNYKDTREIESELTEHILEGYNGFSTIKQLNAEHFYMKKLTKLHENYYKIGKKSEVTAQFEDALDKAVNSILTYVTYGIIGLFLFKDSITLESAVSVLVLVKGFYQGINSIFSGLPKYFLFTKAMERLNDLVPEYNISTHHDFNCKSPLFEFKNLSYGYGNIALINNLNISLNHDSKYAVIGENGCGKSTLIKILSGLNKNYSGEIIYRGRNLNDLEDFEIFNMIDYLPQEDPIIDLTPKELYLMLCKNNDVSLDEIFKNCLILGLDESILNNQNISELSGGQRKKVFLAPALCSKKKVLILDEPTNALDIESKQILLYMIRVLNKSIIMVTHDKDFIDCCDFVLNLSEGGVTK